MQPASLTARAPAKLILAGEHAVLYNQPAIAVAVNCYTQATTSWRADSNGVYFKLADLSYAKSLTFQALSKLKSKLQQEYGNFLRGNTSISTVLKKPFELLQYSVSNILDVINVPLKRGVEIAVDSQIPIGCGMGSSAAAVLSSVYSLCNLMGLDWEIEQYLSLAKKIEDLQHGKSSGVDLQLVANGGCVRYQHDKQLEQRVFPNLKLTIVNTGKPQSTTGECVTKVAEIMHAAKAREFGVVANAVDCALQSQDNEALQEAVQRNQRLLESIQVVPSRVTNFIRDLEHIGAAAKVCGAGSIYGDNAGVVLVIGDQNILPVVENYGYQMQTVEVDNHGMQIV